LVLDHRPKLAFWEQPAGRRSGSNRVARRYERHWMPVHLDFIAEDLDQTVARLVAFGASLQGDIKTREYGRIGNMSDPFGNGFDLIEFTGAGYDAVAR
jgi:predicted enzyme related to lactoylglutathione lyase